MIKINIFCIGKLKEKYFVDACNEYIKRLSKYANVNVIEIEDEKIQNNTPDKIKKIEGEKLLKKLKDNDYLVILDLNCEEYTSEQLANYFLSLEEKGIGNINFAIGGSLGFSDEVKKRANKRICFSKLTFPHQLIRIFLLEQIYRSFKINKNESYHH